MTRQKVLRNFRAAQTNILIATDVAARGIDVPDITHVINYDMPVEAEAYVHRVGRTGRAGASGVALSLCVAAESHLLRQIEQLIGRPVPIDADHPFHDDRPARPPRNAAPRGRTARPSQSEPPRRRDEGAAPHGITICRLKRGRC
jgi:ATP-dependent RNA helicase RhlE